MEANKERPTVVCNVSKLIYWKHPTLPMTITAFDYEQITLATLVKQVYAQAKYWTKHGATVAFRD
jgi:hypothetical protein